MNEPTKTLVPKSRFPEFRDTGDWVRKPLGQVATFYNGRAYKQEELLDHGKYRVLRVGNFFTNNNWYYSDLELDEDKYCDNGDLLYAWSASFGPRIWKGEKVIYHYHIWKVIEKPAIHKDFLFTILNFETEKLKSQSANGLGLMHITKGAIESWEFSLPKPDEQQKIADCLSSIDELITAQTKKIAALKNHKKGLIQQIFPLEGETLPKLRFSEFQDAGEWDQDKLENLINTVTPPQKLPTVLYQAEGQFPIIDQSQSYICGWTNNQDSLIVENLPLIIFGDHTCALKIVNVPFAQGADGIKIIKTKERVETSYLYQYLQFNPVVMEEYKRHFSILKEKLIAFPKIKSGEQQKIADCLSSIDELITAQAQKLESLKTHKKGLMQQLFPNTDEVGE